MVKFFGLQVSQCHTDDIAYIHFIKYLSFEKTPELVLQQKVAYRLGIGGGKRTANIFRVRHVKKWVRYSTFGGKKCYTSTPTIKP